MRISLKLKLLAAFALSGLMILALSYAQAHYLEDWEVLVAAAIVIAVTLALGLFMSFRIAKSVNELEAGAKRFANGDFSLNVAIHSHDEIGNLAAAFNQMSERLRESYRRVAIETQRDEAILESMGEGLIAVDDQARIVLLNSVAAAILELDKQAMAGRNLHGIITLFAPDQKQSGKTPLAQSEIPPYKTLQSGAEVNETFGFVKKDQRQILINIDTSPFSLGGQVVGAIMIIRDVTKEKEIDRMKTEFISLASHQLRTPLSAIKWFSEMLLSGDAGKLESEQADFAKNIADSTERMIDLVDALLNISRIESGRVVIAPQPTDLKELVTGIVNDLKEKTAHKKQNLIISVHQDLPKINLDPRLIGQVYLNLLTNAIKYSPEGAEISVFVSKKDGQVISQVTDNGYGIPKEQQGRVFEKFFRAANAVKIETDGTGLGLYLIKAIIESSGGKIWFKSEEGKGTTFWFSIPLSGMKPKEGEVTIDA